MISGKLVLLAWELVNGIHQGFPPLRSPHNNSSLAAVQSLLRAQLNPQSIRKLGWPFRVVEFDVRESGTCTPETGQDLGKL